MILEAKLIFSVYFVDELSQQNCCCSVMWSGFVEQLYFLLKFQVSHILKNITVILA